MPPINQQGSRTALITALVVFVILFVVSAVFAFNYYGKYQQAEVNGEEYRKRYNGFLTEADTQSPAVAALNAAKAEQPAHFGLVNSPSVTAMTVALRQRDGLAARITGAEAGQSPAAVDDAVTQALKDASDKIKGSSPNADLTGGGLISAVTTLAADVAAKQKSIKDLQGQLAAANAKGDQLTKTVADVTLAGSTALTKAQEQSTADVAKVNQSLDATNANNKQLLDAQAKAVADNQAAAQKSANEVADAQRQLRAVQVDVEKYRARQNRRPYVDDAAVRVADGQLIRVPGGGVCYINLGYGTGVSPGLTFEVYAKSSGVPPIPPAVNGDEQLPVGKASIEITHVGQNSSECRIVKTAPGAVLTEGDVIENLVYDAHQKYAFDVYGNFDLANTGRPNPADAEVVKRLVTQWGGKLTDRISPDTDFLVLGAEPVVPEFGKDDLTPENQAKVQAAQDALDKYQQVRQDAKDLHIPVLNQNRFLYYVGYYDQAKR